MAEKEARTIKDFLSSILIEMKYQTKLLESMVSNQKVRDDSQQSIKSMVDIFTPILDSGMLPPGHPARELLKQTLDKLKRGEV